MSREAAFLVSDQLRRYPSNGRVATRPPAQTLARRYCRYQHTVADLHGYG